MVDTPKEIVEYYADLLILQYVGRPNAHATIETFATPIIMPQQSQQEISFSLAPTSGTFILSYDDVASAAINWNDSIATIQGKLRAISGLEAVLVSGSINSLLLVIDFVDVLPVADILVSASNSLMASAVAVDIAISETDVTLPIAVQNGFNFQDGTVIAEGVQLDVLGKYAGASRSGFGFTQNITLDDNDYATLIRMAIFKNSAGSSLATIQEFLYTYFPGQISVYDYKTMKMSYIIAPGFSSNDLIQMFIVQGLLPKPMGVGITIFSPPSYPLFAFSDARAPGAVIAGHGFTYAQAYDDTGHWLLAQDLIIV